MKYIFYFIAGSIFGFLMFCLIFETGYFGKPELKIKPKTLVQDKIKPAIKYNKIMGCQKFIDELNQYRTNAGGISVKKNRIHSWLFERAWSAEYLLPRTYRNTVSFLFGHGIGIGYNRLFFKRHKIGATVLYTDKINCYFGYGYMF